MTLEQPSLSESLNIMKFSWVNGVSVELHRLHDSGKAEIWARYGENGKATLIDAPAEVNLMAMRSRDDYCNRLTKFSPGLKDFDWNAAFRWIVPMALNAKRAGEPVVELGRADVEIKRPVWDAYPFVVQGMTNILFGDRGSMKSKLALVLCLVMMLPWDDNELGIIAPLKPLKILKLDFEATQDADEYEWRRLLRGMDMEGALQLKYRACRRPLADDIEAIANHADNVKADVLLIDSLGPAAGGDLNASEPALELNAALRQLNRTILMPAHTAKNQLGKRTVFGNSFYENLARNIWEVTKEEDEDSESPIQHIALRQTKSPPFAPHHKPMAFEFDFDQEDERTFVRKYDYALLETSYKGKSVAGLIMDLLNEASKSINASRTPKEMATELGETSNNIYQALHTLRKTKKVVELPGKKYGLASNEY